MASKKKAKKSAIQIPWEDARVFAEKYEKDSIVILAYDSKAEVENVITWGKSIHQSDYAAYVGNQVKEIIGWPDHECQAESARVLEILKANTEMYDMLKQMNEYLLFDWGRLPGYDDDNRIEQMHVKVQNLIDRYEEKFSSHY